MQRTVALVTLTGLAFVLGLARDERPAMAAIPPQACPKYECVEFPWWWIGLGVNTVDGAHDPINLNSINVALIDIFATTSNGKWPTVVANTYDERTYPGCFPQCGLDPINLKWQAPQTVVGQGPKGAGPNIAAHATCTALELRMDGTPEPAPRSDDQGNQADPGTPPGVMTVDVPGRSP